MNKKGQFFLVAALIMAGILISVAVSYNSSIVPKKDFRAEKLAEEMKYELTQVLDYAVFSKKNFSETNKTIKNITSIYASLNPDMKIFVWLKIIGEKSSKIFYENGAEAGIPVSFVIDENDELVAIKDPTRNIYYNLSIMNKSNNIYVLVIKEDKNGRIVIAK
jgi:hypothetical protein